MVQPNPVRAANIATLWTPASRSVKCCHMPSSQAFSRGRITHMEDQITHRWFEGLGGCGRSVGSDRCCLRLPTVFSDPTVNPRCHRFSRDPEPICSAAPLLPAACGGRNEAAVSTQRAKTEQETRFPFAYEYSRRTCCPSVPSTEGSSAAVRVIERLSSRRAFDRLREEGQRLGRGPLRLVTRLDTGDCAQNARIAFAIPRSVGNAVKRNRVRRRIRAVLGEINKDHPDLPPPGDHLIRVTASLDHWSHAKLLSTMTELFTAGTTS